MLIGDSPTRGGLIRSDGTGVDLLRPVARTLDHARAECLVHRVDDELAGPFDVAQGVLGHAAAAVDGDAEQRRLVGNGVEVGERRHVELPLGTHGRDERDRARHDHADHEVIEGAGRGGRGVEDHGEARFMGQAGSIAQRGRAAQARDVARFAALVSRAGRPPRGAHSGMSRRVSGPQRMV